MGTTCPRRLRRPVVAEYAAACLGTGREPCDWTHRGHGFNAAAEKHAAATGHGTTTHLAGGPFERGRTA
jgi:hypothetical protein